MDDTLQACVQESRPVYMEMTSDMVTAPVPGALLTVPLDIMPPANDYTYEAHIVDTDLNHTYASKHPYILIDGLESPDRIIDEVNDFATATGFPTLSYTFGGGIYRGINAVNLGTLDFAPYTGTVDLALLFSPFLTNTNTQG